MGKITSNSGYDHRARKISEQVWEISWAFDMKYSGSRLRYPRVMTRITDKAGAERFAKKWGLTLRDDERVYL